MPPRLLVAPTPQGQPTRRPQGSSDSRRHTTRLPQAALARLLLHLLVRGKGGYPAVSID